MWTEAEIDARPCSGGNTVSGPTRGVSRICTDVELLYPPKNRIQSLQSAAFGQIMLRADHLCDGRDMSGKKKKPQSCDK